MPQVQDTKTYCEQHKKKQKKNNCRVSLRLVLVHCALFWPSNETFFPALPCRHKIHRSGIRDPRSTSGNRSKYPSSHVSMYIRHCLGRNGVGFSFLLVFPLALITHFINFVSLFIAVGNYGYSYAWISARASKFHFFLRSSFQYCKIACCTWKKFATREVLSARYSNTRTIFVQKPPKGSLLPLMLPAAWWFFTLR